MIYKCLSMRSSLDLDLYFIHQPGKDATMRIRIANPSLTVPIPIVCKTICAEAAPMIKKSHSTSRIIIDFKTMNSYNYLRRVMKAFANFLSAARGSDAFGVFQKKAMDSWRELLELLVISLAARMYEIV
jgi:hypothetical protein